ncbi:putative ABC transporter ATP-binding protein [Actinomadura sp. RB99]|uniref:ABC transporter ATP-binding protein n=1 Tax=Actinomadura sp. RB99 TaxID=2691577 RepID=UPI001687E7A5|nr:ABC transporter ATP-binding protein [Actinomadura sp. RB99]MBD2892966.1 putative ABC transporter ATP-binding protein [Actinomadura sp. RB99]
MNTPPNRPASTAPAGLALTGVVLTYPDGDRTLTALDHVTMDVAAGEFAAVAGPSGSGKSSLLAVAALLIAPASGTVAVAGRDAAGLSPAERTRLRRDHIGVVFQQPNLLPALTALDQLTVMAHMAGRSARAAADRARELLAAVGLAGLEHKRPHQLSGGERQRVNIARALMNDPRVLLVDEPTSALDHERGASVVALLARLTRERGVATVMVTHDLAQLDAVDRVWSMRDGRLSETAGAADGQVTGAATAGRPASPPTPIGR